MNVFDFDETIFPVDSSAAFFRFCLRKYPRLVLKNAAGFSLAGARYAAKQAKAAELKEELFSFLAYLPEPEKEVRLFWEKNFSRINSWYLSMKREDDVIISASPEFLLRPVAEKLNVDLLATPMDIHSGRILGRNCHDDEKAIRFREKYPAEQIDAFYSDSLSDAPLARIALHPYLVKHGIPEPWPSDRL